MYKLSQLQIDSHILGQQQSPNDLKYRPSLKYY